MQRSIIMKCHFNRFPLPSLISLFLLVALVFGLVTTIWADGAPQLRVTFLDVGQGDSVIVRTAEKTVLIDGGDDRYDVGSAVIVPYCKKAGIKKFDQVVMSHAHRDHFGGLPDVVREIPVGEIVYSHDPGMDNVGTEASSGDGKLYRQLVDLIHSKNIPYRQINAGDKLDWGNQVTVEVMHAHEILATASAAVELSENEQSLIIKATAGKISYLFTGDAEILAETNAVNAFGNKLKSTVLKSGHHGSKTSSGQAFMEMVQPDYAVISVGTGNSFGHPSPETLDTYAFYNVKTFRTDLEGTVDSSTDGQTVHFTSNMSPLLVSVAPKILSVTANSATLQWETNKLADTQVQFGNSDLSGNKLVVNAVMVHTITITGLLPGMAYKFQVVSHDARQPDQIVSVPGTFTTPANLGAELPKIASIQTNVPQLLVNDPFTVTVGITNSPGGDGNGLLVELYHTSMTPDTVLGQQATHCAAAGNASIHFPVTISWMGPVEVLAVLKKNGQIIDTAEISLTIKPKLLLVDAGHGNTDWYTGRFGGIKMDLARNNGIYCKGQSKPFTSDVLKGVFIVVIPDIAKDFAASELAALKSYVAHGGAVWLFSRANFNDGSHPAILNSVLKGIGATLRFNADEVCDPTNSLGKPWMALIHTFPSGVIQGVKQFSVRSCCSLLNSKMTGLARSKSIELFATGDDDSFQINAGTASNTYYYASHTPILPLPVAAGENVGLGRVAVCGERLYDNRLYAHDASNHAPLFNQSVVRWLLAARLKSLAQLVADLAALDDVPDPNLRATRYELLREEVRRQTTWFARQGQLDVIRDAFRGASAGLTSIRRDVRDDVRFYLIHEKFTPELQHFLKEF